jgi:hypothetical protein
LPQKTHAIVESLSRRVADERKDGRVKVAREFLDLTAA